MKTKLAVLSVALLVIVATIIPGLGCGRGEKLEALFSASLVSGPAPLQVEFADESTGDITAWAWDFGDGGTSTERNPTHTYGAEGTYTVSLEVTAASGSTDTEVKADYVQVGEAVPTGTLTIAVQQVKQRPDFGPFSQDGFIERKTAGVMGDCLVYAKGDGSGFIPGLAKEWVVAADKMSITFTLREGVQFHDGWGELTAEDVKFTIETALDPIQAKAPEIQGALGPIVDRIETSGRYQVTIFCKQPQADQVLYAVSPQRLEVAICCKKYYDEKGFEEALKKPVFSGPYRFVEFQLGDHLTLEAVPDHWRVVPEFKTIVFKEVPEEATRAAMVLTGEADLAEIPSGQASTLEAAGIDIVAIPKSYQFFVNLLGQWVPSAPTYDPNCPFLDERVREALNLAVDKEAIARTILGGYGEATGSTVNFSRTKEPYGYDPTRAEQLLADAGYPDGFTIDMWLMTLGVNIPEQTEIMMAVAGYWQAIGITVRMTPYNVLAVYGKITARQTNGVVLGQPQQLIVGLPWKNYEVCYYSKISYWPMFESEETDVLVEALYAAATAAEKEVIINQLDDYYYDHFNFVPLVATSVLWAKSADVAGFAPWMTEYPYFEYVTHSPALGTYRLFQP